MPVSFHIRERVGELKGSVLITGFHGLGATGYISVKHMVASLKAELIGYIETSNTPPFVTMDEEKLTLPFEIFRYGKLIFVLTEMPPHPKDRYEFSKSLADWSMDCGFSSAYLVGGLDNRLRTNEEDKIRCAPTSRFLKENKVDIPILERGLFVVGPLATMLTRYEIMDFPAIALLPYANPARPDPLAASVAVDYLNKVFNLSIDVSQLIKDAQKIEAEIQEISRRRQERVRSEHRAMYI